MAKLEQTEAIKPANGNDAGEHTARMQAEVQQQVGNSTRATDSPANGSTAKSLPALELFGDEKGLKDLKDLKGGPGGGGGNRCFSDSIADGSSISSTAKGMAGDSAPNGKGTGAYRAGHTDMVTTRHR